MGLRHERGERQQGAVSLATSPAEFNRRAAIAGGIGVGMLVGARVVGGELLDRGDAIVDRGAGLTTELQATIGGIKPQIERAIKQIDVVKDACNGVAPHLGDLEDLQGTLLAILGVMDPKVAAGLQPTTTQPAANGGVIGDSANYQTAPEVKPGG